MKSFTICSALLLTGCTSITFENGPIEHQTDVSRQWHHNAAAGLVEVSTPVNLEQVCNRKKWSSVTTKTTPLNAIAASVTNTASGVQLWTPKTVIIRCQKVQQK